MKFFFLEFLFLQNLLSWSSDQGTLLNKALNKAIYFWSNSAVERDDILLLDKAKKFAKQINYTHFV